jgi:hypothetical protein
MQINVSSAHALQRIIEGSLLGTKSLLSFAKFTVPRPPATIVGVEEILRFKLW